VAHVYARGREFRGASAVLFQRVEYDVEKDQEARARMLELTGGTRTVPVIFERGKPVQVGWMGRGCAV